MLFIKKLCVKARKKAVEAKSHVVLKEHFSVVKKVSLLVVTLTVIQINYCIGLWYAVAEWHCVGLVIARSCVRIPPVYQHQLSVPSLRGRLMSSSLRASG